MSPRPTAPATAGLSEAPTLDFGGVSTFAHFVLTALMCWPEPAERKLRMATLATFELGNGATRAPQFIDRLIALSDTPNPKRSTADLIIRSMTPSKTMQSRWWSYIDKVAEALPEDILPNASSFERFMALCRIPEYREGLRQTCFKYTESVCDELLDPSGGFSAAAAGPEYGKMMSEIEDACQSYPMLAGLVVALAARLAHNHADLTVSLNRVCFVLDSLKDVKASTTTIKASWPKWRGVAPLWAGAIAENGYQPLDLQTLLDIHMDRERRTRMIGYSRWFAGFAASPRAEGGPEPLVPPVEVVRFETPIEKQEPPLPPLEGAALDAAKTYKVEMVRKVFLKKSRK